MSDAYFTRLGDGRYLPTELASGAWNPGEIHFSPVGGLIVHELALHRADGDDKQLARVSFDILGFLALEECEVRVETVRPGRTIELVEATVTIAGRRAALARAWYISPTDTARSAGGAPPALAAPDTLEQRPVMHEWSGGWVNSLEIRPIGTPLPGRTTAWLHTDYALVDGEESAPEAAYIALIDTANGIAVRESPDHWLFPNLDLTIHLYRTPVAGWVGLDTTVTFGPTGLGLTSSALHDTLGPVGRAEQILTVRPPA